MKMVSPRMFWRLFLVLLVLGTASVASAQNLTLRIVCYNIEDDISNANFGPPFSTNVSTPLPGLISPYAGGTNTNGLVINGGVLEGIGEEALADGVAQPADIINFEETSGPSTMNPIVAGLNTYYSQFNPLASNMYAVTPYQATESGGTTNDGNGPNSMVYNTRTLQLLASVPVDPPGGTSKLGSSSGEYREVMRYEFAPANQVATPASEFYIYVSHYKSGTTSTDTNDRSEEAVIIRNNETTLPANARVIYVGDYNVDTSGEPGYQTIVAATSPGNVAQGQGVDPLNAANNTNINWESTTTNKSILLMLTEEDYDLRYRDDLQICTTNVFYNVAGGLCLVTNTYHAFGNNGSLPYGSNVTNTNNTALNDLVVGAPIGAAQLLLDLTGASDHLPVVADYTIPVPAPVAGFTYGTTTNTNNTEAFTPFTTSFTSAVTSGIVTNWFWNFGDGGTSNTYTSLSASYTYTNPGVYSVSLTVTGPGGSYTNTLTNLYTVLQSYASWQLQYFGCTNCTQAAPTTDYDGTGQNNAFKYAAGLNPTNASAVFVFSVAPATNQTGAVNLNFSPAFTGHTYTPQYTTNIVNGTWQTLNASTPVTNGSQVTISDTNTITSAKFYRLNISYP
jgi:PKD repeat protein